MNIDAQELAEIFDVDVSVVNEYEIIYSNSWHTHEEHGGLAILKKDAKFYTLTWGHSVMADDDNGWKPIETTEETAISEILEFEEEREDL